jgi:3-deoxy-D-manno-octulosonic-acid transferase
VRKFLDALQPSMALFMKYEFWPAYLRELKKRAIPTYSLCSIFRPDQIFFRWYGKGQLKLLHCFTQLFVQDEASRCLLAEHGVHEAKVVGDTRFDRVRETAGANRPSATDRPGTMSPDRIQITDRLSPVAEFAEGCERVIVAGSTWPEDEVLLAKYIEDCRLKIEDCKTKLILVPHEIDEEHLHFIFNLFQGRYVRYQVLSSEYQVLSNENQVLSSENQVLSNESRRNILQKAEVLVIDTMGLLSSIYRFGQAAYIGGGFGVGIHNTIEAAAYGMPVIFGPNYHTFREAQGLIDAGAGRSIANYAELEAAIETALEQHATIGQKAAAYVESELGATAKICKEIFAQ